MREDEFERRIEADIAVDDLAALVDDEERGTRAVPRGSLIRRPPVFQAAICSDLMNFHGQ